MRGLHCVKQLASYSANSQNAILQSTEDPLVATLLGGAAPTPQNPQAIHYGFTCDATRQNPIVGPRFKSTSTVDHDITLSARRGGANVGGAGYRIIATRADGMRLALAAIMAWWWLLWPERGDLFNVPVNLDSLDEAALRQAIHKLPLA